jgi:hypothetical protein
MAPRAGFEPATNRLTAGCSTAELPGNSTSRARNAYNKDGPALKAAKRRKSRGEGWRPRPELNRGTRFCRPLRNHSATWPSGVSAWLQPAPRKNAPLYRGMPLCGQRYGQKS